jgi:hypothetical protein
VKRIFKADLAYLSKVLAVVLPVAMTGQNGGVRSNASVAGHNGAAGGTEEPKGHITYSVSGIEFKRSELVASYRVAGLYNLAGRTQ